MRRFHIDVVEPRVPTTRAHTQKIDREWTAGFVMFAMGVTIGALYAYMSTEWMEQNPDRAETQQSASAVIATPTPLPVQAVETEPKAVSDDRSVASAIAASRPRNTGYRGALRVNSQPRGARIFLNDRYVGQTPMLIRALPAGSRAVRLRLDGYQPWSRGVSVVANDVTTVGAKLNRAISRVTR